MTRRDEVRDEMLMALADNELGEAAAAVLRRVIAADPEVARRYEGFVQSRARLQAAFPCEPVPDALVAALRRAAATIDTGAGARPDSEGDATDKVIALPGRTGWLAAPTSGSGGRGWGLALAASMVLAVGGFWAGRSSLPVGPAPDVGPALAANALSQSLTGEAVMLADGRTARALASFQTDIGLCRLIGIGDSRQIACRADGSDGWILALGIASGDGDGFVPASDSVGQVIDQMLDAIGAGPTLGPQEEAAALGL